MDWFPTYDEIRAMLGRAAPDLSADVIEHMSEDEDVLRGLVASFDAAQKGGK